MIKATVKPLEEIKSMIAPYRRVLTIGCGGCVSLCLAGGQKEARSLNIKLHASQALGSDVIFDDVTIERQCEQQFLAALDSRAPGYDAFISLACGAGVQFLAERFPQHTGFSGRKHAVRRRLPGISAGMKSAAKPAGTACSG